MNGECVKSGKLCFFPLKKGDDQNSRSVMRTIAPCRKAFKVLPSRLYPTDSQKLVPQQHCRPERKPFRHSLAAQTLIARGDCSRVIRFWQAGPGLIPGLPTDLLESFDERRKARSTTTDCWFSGEVLQVLPGHQRDTRAATGRDPPGEHHCKSPKTQLSFSPICAV